VAGPPGSRDDLLLVGRVARAHGNKGQVIVNPETDFPQERFAVGQVLVVEHAGHAAERTIASVRFHQGRPIVALAGVETMNDAEALAGAELKMPASSLGPLAGNTYYRHDLVGCAVKDTSGRILGTVTDVQGPLERSLLVLGEGRGEVMIPMVAGIVVSVDLGGRAITVDLPDGLADVNGATE
jgi:16S rRNA processing protein RimM